MSDNLSASTDQAAFDRRLTSRARHRRWQLWLPILALPAALVLLLALVFREQLRPAIPVSVAPVFLIESDGPAAAYREATEMLFQASGWVEPDPWPVRAPVLADGFVDEVLVHEGDLVEQGQVLARLDPTDSRLALEALLLETEEAAADLKAQESALAAAQTRQEAAAARLARVRAQLIEARDHLERIEALDAPDTSPTERVAAEQAVAGLEAGVTEAEAELRGTGLEHRRQEQSLAADRLGLRALETRVAAAQLDLARMVVYAPLSGRVLRRFVEPGAKRMAGMDDPDSATIVTLYDPARLQVRVDVPLAEAGHLTVDQPARVVTALLGGAVLTGRVSRIAGEADITRNTLQAKVELTDPHPRLRPEALCRVEFWSLSGGNGTPGPAGAQGGRALWVPEEALADPTKDPTFVWVVDAESKTAARAEVRVGRERREGRRRVLEGLLANQRVVVGGAEALYPAARVRIESREEHP